MEENNLFSQSSNLLEIPKGRRDRIRTVRRAQEPVTQEPVTQEPKYKRDKVRTVFSRPTNKFVGGGPLEPADVTAGFKNPSLPTHLDPIQTTKEPSDSSTSSSSGGFGGGVLGGAISTAGNIIAGGLDNIRKEQEAQREREGQQLLADHKKEMEGYEKSRAALMQANNERRSLGEEQRAQMLKTQQSALQPPKLNKTSEGSALTPPGLSNQMALGGPVHFYGPKNKQFIGAAVQAAMQVDQAAGKLLAGNKKSGVGSAISALPGGGILGGAISAAFGQSEDTALHQKVDEDTNYLNTFQSNANTFDDVQGPKAVSFDTNVYEDGWFGGDADEKNEALRQKMLAAEDKANRNVENNVTNLQKSQMSNLQATFAAYGGPLSIWNSPIKHLMYGGFNRPKYYNGGIIELSTKADYLNFLKQHPELELEAID